MSEEDPLLPRGRPTPEISGVGYPKLKIYQQEIYVDDEDNDSYEPTDNASALNSLLAVFTVSLVVVFLISLFYSDNYRPPWRLPASKPTTVEARVQKILTETPLIDGHNDLPILIRFFYKSIYGKNFTEPFENGGLFLQVDLARLKEGRSGGAFWSAYVPCPDDGDDFSDSNYAESVSLTLQQIDLIHRLAIKYSDSFGSPTAGSATALRAWKDHKKFVSPMGIEGLHQIGNSYSNLRLFSTLGARYATLTHNCHNKFADAALVTNSTGSTVKAPPQWNGLSKDGDVIIREMNRIGMLVDISHVSHKTMLDVLGATPDAHPGSMAPVMFSHSSAYALCPHPRNVPDNVLSLVKKTNSIVMVNFAPDFISCTSSSASSGLPDFYPVNNTLHQVARHIVYIGELIGYDHVGIGADFDGIPAGPEGLEDVSKMPDLFAELLRMGVSDEDAAKIAGKNIMRVWGEMEKIAAKMQREGKILPAEDPVDSPFNPYASS